MKTETRKYKIRKAVYEEYKEFSPALFNAPLVLEYAGRIFFLEAGYSDRLSVMRYDKKSFAVLSTNSSLGYAGLQIINPLDVYSGSRQLDDTVFIQGTDELKNDLKKDFFEYTENTQADILARFLP